MNIEINTIYCGDCLDIVPTIPKGIVDLVLTDPPFGKVCYRGKGGIGKLKEKNQTYESMVKWGITKKPTIKELKKILAAGINYIVWGGNYFLEAFPSTNCFLIWDKQGDWHDTCFAGVEIAITSFNEVARKFTCRRQGFVKDSKDEKVDHPTPKPTELMTWCIERFTKPGDVVLDPYVGSGTTCVAAKRLGRNFIGIDISEEYCQIARDRLAAEEAGLTVKEMKKGQRSMFTAPR